MILDTSFLLDLKDGDEDAFGQAVRMYEQGTAQRVAMPSVWERHVEQEGKRTPNRSSSETSRLGIGDGRSIVRPEPANCVQSALTGPADAGVALAGSRQAMSLAPDGKTVIDNDV